MTQLLQFSTGVEAVNGGEERGGNLGGPDDERDKRHEAFWAVAGHGVTAEAFQLQLG